MTIGVLIADDDTLVRTGLRLMIETQPDLEVVGDVEDGRRAVELAAELAPDVVLMDIRMPRLDGIEATRLIVERGGETDLAEPPRIVILTTFELDEYVFEAVRAGASGFLLKRTPPEELLDGIRTVAAGDSLMSPSITRTLMSEFATISHQVPDTTDVTNRDLDRLTDREREVLLQLAEGLSNREIADAMFVSESTVKTHVKRILMKLQLRDRIHAAIYAYEIGLVVPTGRTDPATDHPPSG